MFKLQADLKGINGRMIESFSKCVMLVIKCTSLVLGARREWGWRGGRAGFKDIQATSSGERWSSL